MYDEHEDLDEELASLEHTLRDGDVMMSCVQLAEFALKLDLVMRREERALSFAYDHMNPSTPNPLAKVRSEHASLRRLVGLVAGALDRGDHRRGLEVIGKLRSVLLLHVAKEKTIHLLQLHAE